MAALYGEDADADSDEEALAASGETAAVGGSDGSVGGVDGGGQKVEDHAAEFEKELNEQQR